MKKYLAALVTLISYAGNLIGMNRQEYEFYQKEFEEISLINIDNIITQCRMALNKKKLENIKGILFAATHNRPVNTAPTEQDSLLVSPQFSLTESDQQKLAAALFSQLKKVTQPRHRVSCWSRHFTTRTVAGVLSFAIAAGGYFGTSYVFSSDAPWYYVFMNGFPAGLSVVAGVYEFGHHINGTDAKMELNEALALELQLTNVLRDCAISDNILNEMRKTSDADVA